MLRIEHGIVPNTSTTQFHRLRAWLTFEDIFDLFGQNTYVARTMIENAEVRQYGFGQYRIEEFYIVVKIDPNPYE